MMLTAGYAPPDISETLKEPTTTYEYATHHEARFSPLEPPPRPFKKAKKSVVTPDKEAVADLVRRRAAEKLGERWADVAVRIAYVESNFRHDLYGPSTKHGRARGILQVMPGTARAMGFNPSRLTELEYGLAAGLEHMSRCIDAGVRTDAEMSRCHVAGFYGWRARLNGGAERYKHSYAEKVAKAEI
jgi:hypothetical protein